MGWRNGLGIAASARQLRSTDVDVAPPAEATFERPPANGEYKGPLKVRRLPLGAIGDNAYRRPKLIGRNKPR